MITYYSWYIHPPALVRARLPEYQGRCVLCIGPTEYQFADENWRALGPVVTDVNRKRLPGVDFALMAEAHRIEAKFKLKQYGYVRNLEVPFSGII